MMRSRLLLTTALLVVAVVCGLLGVWQLSRLKQRRATNAVALAARSAPVVVLSGTLPDSSLANHRMRAKGRYDHTHDIVLRSRTYRGVPGVEIVSPLVLEDNQQKAVLVNRGFVPSADAMTVDLTALREPGAARVEGIALPIDTGPGVPLRRGALTTWARLDRKALEAELPYHIYPFYIRQSPESASSGFPRRLDAPAVDDGPHLNYAVQWFAFAGMAVIFAGIMARQKRVDRPAPR